MVAYKKPCGTPHGFFILIIKEKLSADDKGRLN